MKMSRMLQLINSILQGEQALIRLFIPSRQIQLNKGFLLHLCSCEFHTLTFSTLNHMDTACSPFNAQLSWYPQQDFISYCFRFPIIILFEY